jgi:hypothetical protein
MARTATRFVTDEQGQRRAVILDLGEYRRLLKRLEELEDALDLDEAVRTARSFAEYEGVHKELKRQGRL